MLPQNSSTPGCIECNAHENKSVFDYSIKNFGVPLCIYHQQWIRTVETTPENVKLYLALRQQGVPARLEQFDGYKTIDIAIPECKVNIEMDSMQHNFNAAQALSDADCAYYTFKNGYVTLRIPNSLVHSNLENTVEYVVGFLNAGNGKRWRKEW